MTITRYFLENLNHHLKFRIHIYHLRNMELLQRKDIMMQGKITSHGQVITPP